MQYVCIIESYKLFVQFVFGCVLCKSALLSFAGSVPWFVVVIVGGGNSWS